MGIRVGINGFGRIGRLAMRAMAQHPEIEVLGINDLVDAEHLAYLFKYDTVHGKYRGEVSARDGDLIIDGRVIPSPAIRNPAELPWRELGVEIVVESTGRFTKREDAAKHLEAGAKKVIISAPGKGEDVTLVLGVNDGDYDPSRHHVISNASCTTNCLAPVVKVVHDNFEITEGLMTTIHAYTATQNTVDGPNKKIRSGRAAAANIIPATTGAAKALAKVIPEMEGRITGMAFRVPVPDVSVVDLTVRTAKATSLDEIAAKIKEAAEGPMKGILGFTDEPLVSSDFATDSHSSIFDYGASIELNSRFFKLVAWYDNEWGYACRIADLVKMVGETL
jgi:glyceraldehyde 3-phosphate dehydrogenase